MRWRLPTTAFAVIAAVALLGLYLYDRNCAIKVPEYPAPTKTIWLNQNWSRGQSDWFHHVDQGTLTFVGIPYEWFVALDRPEIFPHGHGRLSDPDYLDHF